MAKRKYDGPGGPPVGAPPPGRGGTDKAFDGGKNWIKGAIKHPGALHRDLGVPEGQKIPEGKLNAAASEGGKVGQRARLAKTLKGFDAIIKSDKDEIHGHYKRIGREGHFGKGK